MEIFAKCFRRSFCCSVSQLCLALCDPMDCSTPGFPVLHYLPEFAQTHVLFSWWLHRTILSSVVPSPPALNLSQHQGLFKWVSSLHKWLKYWSFNCRISPSNKYSGLIFFRIGWFDLAVQGTLKSLLQHHSLKVSFLWHSVFFIVQLSHPYMTTGKTIALTIWTFVVHRRCSLNHRVIKTKAAKPRKDLSRGKEESTIVICIKLDGITSPRYSL